jgi:hypothetical protein
MHWSRVPLRKVQPTAPILAEILAARGLRGGSAAAHRQNQRIAADLLPQIDRWIGSHTT